MPHIMLVIGLLSYVPVAAAMAPAPAQFPDRPGVFALTDEGLVELPVFGEQRKVEGAIDTFVYAPSDLEKIPVVQTVRALYVNLMSWKPKDLYLIAGGKRLSTPRDDYRRLNGVAYSKGPVLFEIVTEKLAPPKLQDEYRKLTRKKRDGDDVRAFVVVEVISGAGLNRRGYPVQVEMPPPAVK